MSPSFRFTIFIALFLIQCFSLSSYAQAKTLTRDFYSPGPDDPLIYFLTQSFPNLVWPVGVPGMPQIVVSTLEDIQICISGWASVENIAACNGPNNFYFFVSTNNSTAQEEELNSDSEFLLGREDFYNQKRNTYRFNGLRTPTVFTSNVYLRGNIPYYLNIFLNNATEKYDNQTNSVIFSLNWNNNLCVFPNVGLPSGGCTQATWNNGSSSLPPSSPTPFVLVTSVDQILASVLYANIMLSAFNQTTEPMADPTVQVYLRQGGVPTTTAYDAVFTVTINNEQQTINYALPNFGAWYYAFYNPTNYAIITATVSSGYTACPGNTVGPNCNTAIKDLTHLNNATLMNGTGDYQYFKINAPTLLVGVASNSSDNAPFIYASYLNLPSASNNLLQATGNPVNFLYSTIPPIFNDTTIWWFIAVYANQSEAYYIWANSNCPNNCSTNSTSVHGNCTLNTGVCVCDTGYSGLWCSPNPPKKKGLATWAKAVIAVVVIIVVAIIIGIIVGLVLRNRKKKNYEKIDSN